MKKFLAILRLIGRWAKNRFYKSTDKDDPYREDKDGYAFVRPRNTDEQKVEQTTANISYEAESNLPSISRNIQPGEHIYEKIGVDNRSSDMSNVSDGTVYEEIDDSDQLKEPLYDDVSPSLIRSKSEPIYDVPRAAIRLVNTNAREVVYLLDDKFIIYDVPVKRDCPNQGKENTHETASISGKDDKNTSSSNLSSVDTLQSFSVENSRTL